MGVNISGFSTNTIDAFRKAGLDKKGDGISFKELKELQKKLDKNGDGMLSVKEVEKLGMELKDLPALNKILNSKYEQSEILFPPLKDSAAFKFIDFVEPSEPKIFDKIDTELDADKNKVSEKIGFSMPFGKSLSLIPYGTIGLEKEGKDWQPFAGLGVETSLTIPVTKKISFIPTASMGFNFAKSGATQYYGVELEARYQAFEKVAFNLKGRYGINLSDNELTLNRELTFGTDFQLTKKLSMGLNAGANDESFKSGVDFKIKI